MQPATSPSRLATAISIAAATRRACIRESMDQPSIRVENLAVAILPNLTSDALLGMNALRHVRMEQTADRLSLSNP